MVTTSIEEWLNDTLAVLVLYKIPLDQSVAYTSLQSGPRKLNASLDWYIYDNSPAQLNPEFYASFKGTYIHDPSNAGVSKAYNQAIIYAKKINKKWLLLLDQDTVFANNSLNLYHSAIIEYPQESCFVPKLVDSKGIISPFIFRLGNGLRINSVKNGIQAFNTLKFVNSGMMVSTGAFELVNGYDEDFPLDFSDYAFIERMQVHFKTFVLVPLTLRHHHSSTTSSVFADELNRFHTYYRAADLFVKKYQPTKKEILFRAWIRGLKLSIKHKSLRFFSKQRESHA